MNFKFFTALFFVILALRLESIVADESANSSGTATASSEETTTAGTTENETTIIGNPNSSDGSSAAPEGTTTAADAENKITNGASSDSQETTAALPETTTTEATENETTANENSNSSDKSSAVPEQTTAQTAESTTTTTTVKPPPSFSDDVSTSTQNLLGINCIVQAVNNIEDTASDFTYEIRLCGSRVERDAAKVLDKVKSLKTYIKKVQQVNRSVCKNKNYQQSCDAAKTPTANCVKKIQDAMNKLNTNVDLTIQQANKYLKHTTNSCASEALLRFRLTLNNFSATVKECAQLSEKVNNHN